MKRLVRFPTFGWLLQLEWKPQDLWIGVYWKNTPERLDVWVCLPLHYASPIDEANDLLAIAGGVMDQIGIGENDFPRWRAVAEKIANDQMKGKLDD